MVRQRSLRRRRSLRRGRSLRRRRSLRRTKCRFGAEQPSLVKAFVEIAIKNPQAVVPVLELGLTALLDKCGIDPGKIDKDCPDTKELREFLKEWGEKGGLSPVVRSAKFGVVDLLNIYANNKAAMDRQKLQEKKQKKADAAYKADKTDYYNKLAKMEPKVLYTTPVTEGK